MQLSYSIAQREKSTSKLLIIQHKSADHSFPLLLMQKSQIKIKRALKYIKNCINYNP